MCSRNRSPNDWHLTVFSQDTFRVVHILTKARFDYNERRWFANRFCGVREPKQQRLCDPQKQFASV